MWRRVESGGDQHPSPTSPLHHHITHKMRQIELLHSLALSNYVGEVRVHVWGVESEFWGGITFGMQMNISVAVLCASACVFGGVNRL